ncbi:unnamed protein product [Ambrosiozyma monospora]|uniref:Unnamed protein product n=1 Tax=Ambrosiozyma monospora TaxID=43982 RepID=A0ACB5TC55_AMBMO|nr:unnamed protein product [Ambrosiozyma monospora]
MQSVHEQDNPFNDQVDPDDSSFDDGSSGDMSVYSVDGNNELRMAEFNRMQQQIMMENENEATNPEHQLDGRDAVSNQLSTPPSDTDSQPHNSSHYEYNLPHLLDPIPPDFQSLGEGYSTWEIADINGFQVEKTPGPKFQVGDYIFNLLVVHQRRYNYTQLSVYLESHPVEQVTDGETEDVAKDWFVPVQFAIDAWNPDDPSTHKNNRSHFRYSPLVTDWGFVNLISTKTVMDNQIISKGKLNLTVYVRVIDDYTGVLWHDFREYNSKKSTGYVGINNQGATCYLNSLLQSYFFTKKFRNKVYQIPTEDELNFNIDWKPK